MGACLPPAGNIRAKIIVLNTGDLASITDMNTIYKNKTFLSFLFSAGIHCIAAVLLSLSFHQYTSRPFLSESSFQTVVFHMGSITIPSAKIEKNTSEEKSPVLQTEESPVFRQKASSLPHQDKSHGSAEEHTASAADMAGENGMREITISEGDRAEQYIASIRKKLQENIFYPFQAKMLGLEGNVILTFQIDPDGGFKNLKILTPSKHRILNNAAYKIVQNSVPFPSPPKEFSHSIQVPLTFQIKN